MAEDASSVLYEYFAYNLNKPGYKNAECRYDGVITIRKACLVEPEIHERIRRMPGGRKRLTVKRIPKAVSLSELLLTGGIEIENSGRMWHAVYGGVDLTAVYLCRCIFEEYQKTGNIPESCGFAK